MSKSRRVLASLYWPIRLIRPTLLMVLLVNRQVQTEANRQSRQDFGTIRDMWASKLKSSGIFRSKPPSMRESIGILYQDSVARLAGFESKSIGVLQGVAIIAAGAIVAFTGHTVAVEALAASGLVYLVTAGWACSRVLLPQPVRQLTLSDIDTVSDGYVEMVASIKEMETIGLISSNLVTSALADLLRATTVIVAALLLLIMGK